MVAYLASRSPLPLVLWQPDARAFNVTELDEHEQPVLRHFSIPHVRQAGSHTNCGCGFNEGRGHPEAYAGQAAESAAARESSSRLARYVRAHRVEQIYSCWSGDEGEPKQFERRIRPDDLVAPEFVLRERELLVVAHDAG